MIEAGMLVQKYGGSSVGSPEKIRRVADRIARSRARTRECSSLNAPLVPVVVVVSAMGDTTDELIGLARQVVKNPHDRSHERELDMLLSAGERISMALLAMALRDLGHEAISFTGSQAGIITDESHTRARILEIRPMRVREELDRGRVVIVAGFQGVSRTKEVTTLGRGGSDTTAVALAAALGASRCEVYTDVPGIFSADPRVVPGARRYARLPLDLMLEMAEQGAQVMHSRSIESAIERRLPVWVGSSMEESEGTLLTPEGDESLPEVVAVTGTPGQVAVVGSHMGENAALRDRIQAVLAGMDVRPVSLTCHSRSIRVCFSEQDTAPVIRRLHEALINGTTGSSR
jgi:aspartate kinase